MYTEDRHENYKTVIKEGEVECESCHEIGNAANAYNLCEQCENNFDSEFFTDELFKSNLEKLNQKEITQEEYDIELKEIHLFKSEIHSLGYGKAVILSNERFKLKEESKNKVDGEN